MTVPAPYAITASWMSVTKAGGPEQHYGCTKVRKGNPVTYVLVSMNITHK